MRHDKLAPVILMLMAALAVFVSASGCNGERAVPAAKAEVVAPACRSASDIQSDTVSGCACGAALVKVLIDLQPKNGHCVAEVTPASVCVAPGGVVRFKIQNDCPALAGAPGRPALEITPPEFKRPLRSGPQERRTDAPRLPAVFANCELKVTDIIKSSEARVLWCDVQENAFDGFYKYGLRGLIDPLDPDVEVRGGGK